MIIGSLVASKRRVRLRALRPGLFTWLDTLCVKNDYGESYIVHNGDALMGGAATKEERDEQWVRPVKFVPVI